MGARFGGLVIDSILIAVPTVIIAGFTGAYHRSSNCDAFGNCTSGVQFNPSWPVDLIALVLGIGYSAVFGGLYGQTLGHRIGGIRVVDLDTGAVIGPARAALRWFILILTGAICTLGYWSPFFDSQRRQGWHDKASNSVAIPATHEVGEPSAAQIPATLGAPVARPAMPAV
jgi:uncharacterized RDD family membrane protein YckC